MRIGIDLGGTKTEGIVLDSQGTERARLRLPTPGGDYAATLATICAVVRELEDRVGEACSVGVGIPGAISPASGLIKNANSTCLIGKALDRDLAERLERPVRLENDANCMITSEVADGAAQGAQVAFGVILGTGVGGGVAFAGRPHRGPNAIAGEWGHNPLPWPQVLDGRDERPGRDCYCGKAGCIETWLSGPGLLADADTGATTVEALLAQASDGDAGAEAALVRYEHRLARGLASVIDVLDPDVVVLAGGLSNLDRLYVAVPRLLQDWVFSDRADTAVVRARHGDSSGVRGAAWLWPAEN